jgi:hypothetical protein
MTSWHRGERRRIGDWGQSSDYFFSFVAVSSVHLARGKTREEDTLSRIHDPLSLPSGATRVNLNEVI